MAKKYIDDSNVFLNKKEVDRIADINQYVSGFKERHSEIFKDDVNDDFIKFNTEGFSTDENLKFNIEYDNRVPIEIRNEFMSYFKK